MDPRNKENLLELYRNHLYDSVLPFWMRHSIDGEYGGYMTWLDRDGSLLATDKAVWMQGRGVWTFSRIYNEFTQDEKYLDAARKGYEFLSRYCIDDDGRMFFRMTRDGRPVRKRRYVFSDVFGAAGFAEYYKATADPKALKLARSSFDVVYDAYENPEAITPKYHPGTRDMISHSPNMIIVDLCKTMREIDDSYDYDGIIKAACETIVTKFYKPDIGFLLENVGPGGGYLSDVPEGRCVNPGHAIESAWFIMEEAILKGYEKLFKSALEILDSSIETGWDREYGGIFYFLDSQGGPPYALEWDQKLWWPHNEALYALLLAYRSTGEDKYATWYDNVHKWAFDRFFDQEYGEWFGYLHRDGSLSSTVKGGIWKGAFHVPRFYMKGIKLLEK